MSEGKENTQQPRSPSRLNSLRSAQLGSTLLRLLKSISQTMKSASVDKFQAFFFVFLFLFFSPQQPLMIFIDGLRLVVAPHLKSSLSITQPTLINGTALRGKRGVFAEGVFSDFSFLRCFFLKKTKKKPFTSFSASSFFVDFLPPAPPEEQPAAAEANRLI